MAVQRLATCAALTAALFASSTLIGCSSDSSGGKTGSTKDPVAGDEDEDEDEANEDEASETEDEAPVKDAGKPAKGKDAGLDAKVGDASKPAAANKALPSEVCGVLQKNGCLTCHKTPLAAGASMPLALASDFAGTADDGKTSIADAVIARVQDTQRPMPPPSSGRPKLSQGDVDVLKTWIADGMKPAAGETACVADSAVEVVGDKGAPSWALQPWPEDECEYVFTVGAHGEKKPLAQDATGYPVPTAKTDYHCFYEQVPWGNKPVHAIGLRVRVESPEDMELVHHLVLSAQSPNDSSLGGSKPSFNGDHKQCDNPTGSTIAVWAPGGPNPQTFPSDVGVQLPTGNAYFELQIHYNNVKGAAGKKSTVKYDICATSKLRKETAGVFWLGYENANIQTVTGTEFLVPLDNQGNGVAMGKCKAKTKARILSIGPHMHEAGKHAKFEIMRKTGKPEMIVDEPFDFQSQVAYFHDDLWIEAGETVRTTCEWSKSPVNFGFASNQEMCFFYTLAYPLEAFKAGPGEEGIVGGNLACAAQAGP